MPIFCMVTCHFASDRISSHRISFLVALLPTQLMLLLVVVMLDLLNAKVLEGTELKEVAGGGGGGGGLY